MKSELEDIEEQVRRSFSCFSVARLVLAYKSACK